MTGIDFYVMSSPANHLSLKSPRVWCVSLNSKSLSRHDIMQNRHLEV